MNSGLDLRKINLLSSDTTIGFYMLNKFSEAKTVNNQMELWQKLLKWHFDIYGLIENGLAIDINTLKQ